MIIARDNLHHLSGKIALQSIFGGDVLSRCELSVANLEHT